MFYNASKLLSKMINFLINFASYIPFLAYIISHQIVFLHEYFSGNEHLLTKAISVE
jgi:hypothetical protein